MNKELICIDSTPYAEAEGCEGPVELRTALSGTGIPYARCDNHWAHRLDREQEIRDRYPDHPPADWSPEIAGEAWYESDY